MMTFVAVLPFFVLAVACGVGWWEEHSARRDIEDRYRTLRILVRTHNEIFRDCVKIGGPK